MKTTSKKDEDDLKNKKIKIKWSDGVVLELFSLLVYLSGLVPAHILPGFHLGQSGDHPSNDPHMPLAHHLQLSLFQLQRLHPLAFFHQQLLRKQLSTIRWRSCELLTALVINSIFLKQLCVARLAYRTLQFDCYNKLERAHTWLCTSVLVNTTRGKFFYTNLLYYTDFVKITFCISISYVSFLFSSMLFHGSPLPWKHTLLIFN